MKITNKRIALVSLIIIDLFLLIILMSSLVEVIASDPVPFEEKEYRLPIVDNLNLLVDGSITPVLVNLTEEFDYIQMMTICMVWRSNDIDFDKYGLLPMLTNGTEFLYDNNSFLGTFNCLECYLDIGVDSVILSDDKNPVDNHFKVFIRFNDYIVPDGLKMREGHTFNVRVNDNLTVAATVHHVELSGYRLIDKGYEFQRPFLEELFLIDNPVELLMIPIVFPLAFIFTAEPIYVIFGVAIFIVEVLLFRMLWVHWRYR